MRISDWSSDVCSSDLLARLQIPVLRRAVQQFLHGNLRSQDQVGETFILDRDRRLYLMQRGLERSDAGRQRSFQMDVPRDDAFVDHQPRAPRQIAVLRREEAHEGRARRRSEEHTSELQSLMRISYAVFCLKKKTTQHNLYQTP